MSLFICPLYEYNEFNKLKGRSMPKKVKLDLNDLSVKSFVTINSVKGGVQRTEWCGSNMPKCMNSIKAGACIPQTEYNSCRCENS